MHGVRKNPLDWIGAARRMTTFGKIIKTAREAKNLKQREVAKAVDQYLESSQIWRWEADRNLPTAERVARLIELLELDADQVWRVWGEAQVPSRAAAVADAISAPVKEKRGSRQRSAANEQPLPPSPRPRARRGTRLPDA